MRVGAAEHFTGDFGRRVWRDRLQAHFAFDERSFAGGAVNGTGRAEDEILNSELAAEIEKVKSAGNIDALVELRLLDRWAHAGERGEVNYRVRAKGAKDFANPGGVANIGFIEIKAAYAADAFEIGALPGRGIEIVERIDDGEPGAAADQGFGQMRAYESGAAGQQNFSGCIYQEFLRNFGRIGRLPTILVRGKIRARSWCEILTSELGSGIG